MASRVSPYIVTKTRSLVLECKASATSFVGNGRNATTSNTSRLIRSNSGSVRVSPSVSCVWPSQAAPIVRKLTT